MIDDPERRASDLRLRHGLILVLAAHAGAMDALGLLALQAFTSVQTGNMILAGVGIATDDWRHVLQAVAAISCFALGCVVSVRITGTPQTDDGIWPTEITRALCGQLVVMAFFCIGWWLTGSDPGPSARLLFIIANSFGMGIQSAAIQRFGAGGLSTTYLTGMLTVTMVRVATRGLSPQVWQNLRIIVAVIFGAAVTAVLVEHAAWAAPIAQITSVAVVVVVARRRLEGRPSDGASSPGTS